VHETSASEANARRGHDRIDLIEQTLIDASNESRSETVRRPREVNLYLSIRFRDWPEQDNGKRCPRLPSSHQRYSKASSDEPEHSEFCWRRVSET
jgi:hypothetical protein